MKVALWFSPCDGLTAAVNTSWKTLASLDPSLRPIPANVCQQSLGENGTYATMCGEVMAALRLLLVTNNEPGYKGEDDDSFLQVIKTES